MTAVVPPTLFNNDIANDKVSSNKIGKLKTKDRMLILM